MVGGEVFHLPALRGSRGHEQRGSRYAVVVQADEFLNLSTTLVAPTSTSALPTSVRPTIMLSGRETRVSSSRRRSSTASDSVDRPGDWMRGNSGQSMRP